MREILQRRGVGGRTSGARRRRLQIRMCDGRHAAAASAKLRRVVVAGSLAACVLLGLLLRDELFELECVA